MYEEYSARIFGYCIRRLPNREEAEDAVQQTFLNAFRGLQKGVVPRSEAAWLFKIAENVCRERRRSAWRRNRLELVQDPDDMASLAGTPLRSHDELGGLADALAELPPNQQRAILLREWQGLSYKEIAEQVRLTEGAVETLLFRARRSLARKLDRSRGRHWGLGSLATWPSRSAAARWRRSPPPPRSWPPSPPRRLPSATRSSQPTGSRRRRLSTGRSGRCRTRRRRGRGGRLPRARRRKGMPR